MPLLSAEDIVLLWKDNSTFHGLDTIANLKPFLPADNYIKLYGSTALRNAWSQEDHFHALGIDVSPLFTWKW